jgi:hypothetical protein
MYVESVALSVFQRRRCSSILAHFSYIKKLKDKIIYKPRPKGS